jgi:hypothetical protein
VTTLTIKVEAMAGSHVGEIINDMCSLATRLGSIVRCDLNGVTTMVKPNADPRDAYALWSAELESSRPYKIICAHPVGAPTDYTANPEGQAK